MHGESAYGLWLLAAINSLVFIIFAFSFTHPQTKRDWRSLGAFSAFILALFTEMYGFPLTIYLLSEWLGQHFSQLDIFSHNAGHLWHTLFGLKGDAHFDIFHLFSYALIGGGFVLLSAAWKMLHEAQQKHTLAIDGPYAYLRHPQYIGFILIMLGFLFQWPTLLTLLMFPVLVWMYVKLARQEEHEVRAEFGEEYAKYAATTPGFIPRLRDIRKAAGTQ